MLLRIAYCMYYLQFVIHYIILLEMFNQVIKTSETMKIHSITKQEMRYIRNLRNNSDIPISSMKIMHG